MVEYGHVSKAATVAIKVVAVAGETNPFNKNQTALFVGGAGSSTVSFDESGKVGIAVTINGTNEGVFTTTGPLIVFTQGPRPRHGGLGVEQCPRCRHEPDGGQYRKRPRQRSHPMGGLDGCCGNS